MDFEEITYKNEKINLKINYNEIKNNKKYKFYQKMLNRANIPINNLFELKNVHNNNISKRSIDIIKESRPDLFNNNQIIDNEADIILTQMNLSSRKSTKKEDLVKIHKNEDDNIINNNIPDLLPDIEERIDVIPHKKKTSAFPGQCLVISDELESQGAENFFPYKGGYKDGHLQGVGKYWFIDGGIYNGGWNNDEEDGQGIAKYSDGSTYEGYWKNGKYNGYGIMIDINGNKYDGHWYKGKRHGFGKIEYNDGSIYEGMFYNDKINGNGTMKSKLGYTYTGLFRNNKVCGKGIMILNDNKKYEREWPEKTFQNTVIDLIKEIKENKLSEEKRVFKQSVEDNKTDFNIYIEKIRQANKIIEEMNKKRLEQEQLEKERLEKARLDREMNEKDGIEYENTENDEIDISPPPPPPPPPPKKENKEEEKNKEDDEESNWNNASTSEENENK